MEQQKIDSKSSILKGVENMIDSVVDKSKVRSGVGSTIEFNENNYEKFIKFCELNGYDLLDCQKELARSMLDGNNHYSILPRHNGRKQVQECMYKLRKLYGLPPYDKGYNPCYKDGYYARSIIDDYGQEVMNKAKECLEVEV